MSIKLSSNFLENAGIPLDARTVVADITARDAIPSIQRFDGLTVYVTASSITYQLQGGTTNSNWVVFGSGGSGGSPGGSAFEVQINDGSGGFSSVPGFTWGADIDSMGTNFLIFDGSTGSSPYPQVLWTLLPMGDGHLPNQQNVPFRINAPTDVPFGTNVYGGTTNYFAMGITEAGGPYDRGNPDFNMYYGIRDVTLGVGIGSFFMGDTGGLRPQSTFWMGTDGTDNNATDANQIYIPLLHIGDSFSSAAFPSADGLTGQTFMTDGAGLITWTSILEDQLGAPSFDFNLRQSFSTDGTTVEIDSTGTVSGTAALSFDAGQHAVFLTTIESTSGLTNSVDTNNRLLIAADGTTNIIDWSGSVNSPIAALSFDGLYAVFSTGIESLADAGVSIATNPRELWISTRAVLSWQDQNLLDISAGEVMMNWSDAGIGITFLNLSANPVSPVESSFYYNDAAHVYRFYNGTSWIDMSGGGGSSPWTETAGVVNLTTGTDTVEIQTSIHEKSGHVKVADFNSQQLFWANGLSSVLVADWSQSTLNVGSNPVVLWADHQLWDNSGNIMMIWGNTIPGAGVAFPNFIGSNVTHKPLIDTENGLLFDATSLGSPVTSEDFVNRILFGNDGTTAMFTWTDPTVGYYGLSLSSAPASPIESSEYYDTTLHQKGYYDGTSWIYPGAGSTPDLASVLVVGNSAGSSNIFMNGNSITTISALWNGSPSSSTGIELSSGILVDSIGNNSSDWVNRINYANDGSTQMLDYSIAGSFDVKTNNIVNLADGVNPQDAVTVSQLSSLLPTRVDFVGATGQSADITTTAFAGTSVSGLYRISYYLFDSAADLTAGAVTLNITYTDDSGAQTISSSPVILTTLGAKTQGDVIVETASGSVSYNVSHTGIFGTATYNVYLTAEKLA